MDKIKDVAYRLGIITVEDMERYTALELIMMITNKLTETQKIVNIHSDEIQYLLNEGLESEVVQIFNEWIQDGTFDTLINQSALKEVNAELSKLELEKATKTEVNAVSNRVDNLIIQSGESQEKDAELVDLRVSFDGVTYPTAGANVRESDKLLNENKCNLITNLLNLDECVDGGFYDQTGAWVESQNIYSSGLIPVVNGKMSINPDYKQPVTLWNEEGTFNGYTTANKGVFDLTGRTAKYFRFYGTKGNKNTDMVVRSSSYPSQYVPYGKPTIRKEEIESILSTVTTPYPLQAKDIYIFGDSRTWYDGQVYGDGTKTEFKGKACIGFQQEIINRTKATITSFGYNGKNSIFICEQIKTKSFSGVDMVILDGGVNDYIVGATLGELKPIGSLYDANTVYGAWQSAIEHIMSSNPKCKIIVNTPFVCWDYRGKLPSNIALAKKEIANLYSLDCLDLYNLSNINEFNRDNFYVDDFSQSNQWRLHLNNDGNEWLGSIIANFISTKYF